MIYTTTTDETQIQRIYSQLTFLGFLLHITQTIIFYYFSCPALFVYNGISTAFYALMLYVIHRRMYRLLVSAIHIETCLFAMTSTITCGWGGGVSLYLLAMSSLVYFCPFNKKIIPYVFSIAELAVFVFLRIYSHYNEPLFCYMPQFTEMAYFIFNALACFYIILFAAYSSNISAMVTNIRLRSENKNLTAIANSDLLTSLPNRHAFFQHIEKLSSDSQITVAIGDLDDFKKINDSFGHVSGDYVLRTVGKLMSDGCPEHSLPCRWGGEEFVILFDCPLADAIGHLQNLRNQIAAYPFEYDGQTMKITITFGAFSGNNHEGVESLIEEADKYLYKGKQSGKNCVSSPFT